MKWFDFLNPFVIKDGVLVEYRGKKSRVTIPDTVTAIGDAFYSNKKLVEVVIPQGVTEIRDHAFGFCTNLKTVHLPAGVTLIGEGAFHSCTNLRKINLPDVEEIRYKAFENCRNLEEIVLPEREFLVASKAFAGCDKFADRDGFIVLHHMLFDYIGSDAHIVVPEGVEIIGSGVFWWERLIETVVCPNSVRRIMHRAFCYCENMTSITIPNRAVEISEDAFEGCRKRMTFRAPEGSTVEQYVNDNRIRFEVL